MKGGVTMSIRKFRRGRQVEYVYYKIKLHNLTDAQKQRATELYGVSRFVYNTFLDLITCDYDLGRKLRCNYEEMCKILTQMRQKGSLYEWLADYDVSVERSALKDLDEAFEKFFASSKRLKSGEKLRSRNNINHFPKFKKKKSLLRFGVRGERITFSGKDNRYVHIPGLTPGRTEKIDCKHHNIPYHPGIVYENARIVFDGTSYWLTLAIKVTRPFKYDSFESMPGVDSLGIDVGLREAAVVSDGSRYQGPDKHRLAVLFHRRDAIRSAITNDIDRRQEEARRTKAKYEDIQKSKNQLKREALWHKTNKQIHDLYETCYHNISKDIARKCAKVVVIETLDVKLMRRHSSTSLSSDIIEGRMARLTNMIEYKCKSNGSKVIRAPFGFKSSQICSNCGCIHNPGDSKTYICPSCGLTIDRDLNAAYNLRDYGLKSYSI